MDTKHRSRKTMSQIAAAKYLAGQALKYGGGPALAYMAGSGYKTVPGARYGLSGEGFRGGAAPLPSKSGGYKKRIQRKKQERKKCSKLKGFALKKKVCHIENQLKDLRRAEDASLGLMTYRNVINTSLRVGDNVQKVASYAINRSQDYESVLANLKYYDPSDPANLVTASGVTGAYQKEFLVKNINAKLEMRNNYQSDVCLTVYLCIPKSDSSISPDTAWTNGITTDAGNVLANTELNQYPTDYDVFRDLWTAKRVCYKKLSPGQSATATTNISDVTFDPALYAQHSADYQRRWKSQRWLVVVTGTISHDSVSPNDVGLSSAGVDILISSTWKVQYDAGVNISYVYLDTTYDTPGTGFVQSHQPVADNISYSFS